MVEPKSLTQIISEDEFLLPMGGACKQFFSVFFLFKRRNEEKQEGDLRYEYNNTR